MEERIAELIREQLNLEEAEIGYEDSFEEDLGIDSVDLFELVMQLEEEFDLEIPSEDLSKLTSISAVVNYLKERGVEE